MDYTAVSYRWQIKYIAALFGSLRRISLVKTFHLTYPFPENPINLINDTSDFMLPNLGWLGRKE